MQTIISEIAFTFVDDAVALARGFVTVARDLAAEMLSSARARILAPVDRLARACDVGGVIAAREAATLRRHRSANWQPRPAPRRWRDRFNIFRGLQDLT
ncbi:MAG TPA: hypothetical protein VGD75_17860, partial [Bradyrhizobium sp.]